MALTPTVLQMDPVENGPACLKIVLAHYGRYVPLSQLRTICGVSRDGIKPSKLVAGARHFGLLCKAFDRPDADVRRTNLPCIVFWELNSFVVVERFGKKYVWINDPAEGHRRVTWDEFNRSYTGLVLGMTPGPEFRKGGTRPSGWEMLTRRLPGAWTALLVAFLCGVLLVLPGLAIPTLTRIFFDQVIGLGRSHWLAFIVFGMLMAMVMQLALKWLQLTYLRRLRTSLVTRLSSQFVWKMLRLPVVYFSQRSVGEVTARNFLNENVADSVAEDVSSVLVDLFTMTVYFVVMVYYDTFLTVVAMGFASFNYVVLRWIEGRRNEANLHLGQEAARSVAIAHSGLTRLESVKASGTEGELFEQWAEPFTRYVNTYSRFNLLGESLAVLPRFLTISATTMILILGGWRVLRGEMSIGMLVAYQQLMTQFLAPVTNLVNLSRELQELKGDMTRLDDVLGNESVDLEGQHQPEEQEFPRLRGDLEISGLSYGYCELDPPLMTGFSLHVQPGKRVALVGTSGSGRSTVSRMVVGLLEPWSGEMKLDGRRFSEYPRWMVRNAMAFVDQDIVMFQGTVRDNLTLFDSSVPDSLILQACRDAAVDDVVLALPREFDSLLEPNASNLSAGQRQRLEIARALLRNPTILVLDEATSSLDAETERIILDNIRRRGCTTIIVAHRLSAFRDCDEIIMLHQGVVMERGTHEALMKADGPYARMVNASVQPA